MLPEGKDIVDVVVGKTRPTSDVRICREVLEKFDREQGVSGDKAYLGESQIRTPSKKPKNGELTKEQKEENKVLSFQRFFVEHLIRLLEIFKVLQERFCLNKKRYKSVFLIVCGSIGLRIKAITFKIIKWTESEPVINVAMGYSFREKLDFET
ncbi:transposase family protein [Baaleninema simplex]|uniref:transposase family protein n=1 Tax=Baaleninema simplex TaxID=2862350 RepID=UPI00034969F7|nr:transposase family protein [Baaleninema simplex]